MFDRLPAAVPAAGAASCGAAALLAAARLILPILERGQRLDAKALRAAMQTAFGASDAEGAWDWKSAYDVCEAAQLLFLRKYGASIAARAGCAPAMLAMIEKIAALAPTHTRRSEESQALQQFSTPLPLGFVAAHALAVQPGELVLEPSAGVGLLAIHAERAGARLALNELADTRADLLGLLFPDIAIARADAAQIDDRLDPGFAPTAVLMNPPFSALAHVERTMKGVALRHIASALARLAPGGRLVAIVGASTSPEAPAWSASFARLQEHARLLFSAAIDGRVYARHGTSIQTRLLVFERRPAENPRAFPASHGTARDCATLLAWLDAALPPREALSATPGVSRVAAAGAAPRAAASPTPSRPIEVRAADVAPLDYEVIDWTPPQGAALGDAIYEPYALQSLRIPGAQAHATALVQSSAMASVAPPKPSYRPRVPRALVAGGILSDAQVESLIYAGEAHSGFISGAWRVDETWDKLSAAPDDAEDAVRFRRGWFLGDGAGCGKGRQVAGIILDHWLQGRRRALWISKSDKLIEDAQRDWAALGQERLLVTPLSRFRQGAPIHLDEGILFCTYATLRAQERGEKCSRVRQIVDWLGADFDGVVVFDEAHAMANAAGQKGERGEQAPSQQGRAGLRLQHALPLARTVYVSATGATTVQNLAYAQRLGLWGGEDFPFATRADFVAAIEDGGVAAMEVLARDLKALGLYMARAVSFDGVEYELLEHELTTEQRRIYDAYAGAFQIIHNNLDTALKDAGISSETGATLNAQAKAAARSAFESAKQRFFNHLIVSMQTPSVLASIERDLAQGHSAVVQLVSTGEALTERRLSEIPTDQWADVDVDVTPREYVLDYLARSFPVHLFETYTDTEGNLASRQARDKDGNPILCRAAVARRDRMIERLAALPPVPVALDQLVQRFGAEAVAEVTGRSRRIVPKPRTDGSARFAVESRPGSANYAETHAFMDDAKRILVFSEAGGTGRSYHADRDARNQRLRVHYLLEAGWKADNAIQGFGRTHRTNQAQPPLYRPVSTDVKAQRRFISTIARRLDSMGALTRGQRQTGGQNMFRPEDNLESAYARDALRQLYVLIVRGKIEGCSLDLFEAATGLSLLDASGGMKDELPPITQFLNRMLALTIDLQNVLFEAFEGLLIARIEGAVASGTYEVGLETLRAESFIISDRRVIYTHAGTGAETSLLTIARKVRNAPRTLQDALKLASERHARLLVNARSGRAAVQAPARSSLLDDGSVEQRVRLIRPMDAQTLALAHMDESHWADADRGAFAAAWETECAELPAFHEDMLHMVSGLLLPIWRRLPDESTRVYRLQTDDGERVIGRRVSAAWVASILGADAPTLSAADAWPMLLDGRIVLRLADGQQLARVTSMHAPRIELTGYDDLALERLKALGLISEIVSWKLRLFVPTGAEGPAVLERLLDRYPMVEVVDRAGAKAA